MKKLMLIACAVVCMQVLRAQDSTRTLDEIIVTASKAPIKQSQTGKVVSVITKKMIEENAGKNLGEILNMVAGLTINGADNNLGTNPSVYLQGAGSGNTLILVDGIPLYDASGISGEFDLNNFDISNLDKIEILKGAQSTLYGSDAVAGVINLITDKESSKPINVRALLAAGTYGTYKGNVALSGTTRQKITYSASYSKVYSNGFSAAYDSTGKGDFDKDGFNRDLFMAKFGFHLKPKLSISIFGKYSKYTSDIDAGAFTDDKDYTNHNDNTLAGIMLTHRVKKGFIRFQYYANWYNRNFVDDSTDIGGFTKYQHGRYNGFSHYAELFTNLKLSPETELLAGADYRYNSTSQFYIFLPDYGMPSLPISGDSARTHQLSGYASLHYRGESGFGIETGGRFNYHNIYGGNYTTSLNPYFNINSHYKIFATLASGYRVPSLYQLYSEFGNKKLKPESTSSAEAGASYSGKTLFLRLTGFLRSGKDVIIFYSDPVTFAGKYMNGDKQNDYGFEAEANFTPSTFFSASINYTFVDGKVTTENNGKDSSYFNLYKRPKHVLNATAQINILPKFSIGLSLRWAGKSYEGQYMAAPYELDGYYTLGAHLNYQVSGLLSLFTNFQNITDQKYFVTRGYNTKGFNFMGGVKINF